MCLDQYLGSAWGAVLASPLPFFTAISCCLEPPEASIEEPVEPGFVIGRFRRYATALVKMG